MSIANVWGATGWNGPQMTWKMPKFRLAAASVAPQAFNLTAGSAILAGIVLIAKLPSSGNRNDEQ